MSSKIIPFLGGSKKTDKVPAPSMALDSKGPKDSKDGKIVDHGTLAQLEYEVYDRGVIHIFDKDLRFKKDIYIFEDEIKKIKFEKMGDGEIHAIQGSGDNDHLVFTKQNGDVQITLKSRDFEAVTLLKSILNKGKQCLTGGSK